MLRAAREDGAVKPLAAANHAFNDDLGTKEWIDLRAPVVGAAVCIRLTAKVTLTCWMLACLVDALRSAGERDLQAPGIGVICLYMVAGMSLLIA
ncbi:hypothetical protein BJ138DRAFT_818741 [Hygrophoropsis aurantiaca]|uniref:Uncharacterized protein n=1 Tax=Hygrophoropsis aurantiaca TaxID=72124 RepID=A0ACB8AFU4_9AGAM|nr:hypothetical protein BJ138DRAFT_818741 [Hygrophoropsis aurantiaca]